MIVHSISEDGLSRSATGRLRTTPCPVTADGDGQVFDLDRIAERIHALGDRIVSDMIAIGNYFWWVKSELAHGEFVLWVENEAGIAKQRAREFMHLAKRAEQAADKEGYIAGLRVIAGDSKSKIQHTLALPESEIVSAGVQGTVMDRPISEVQTYTVRQLELAIREYTRSPQAQEPPPSHTEDRPEAAAPTTTPKPISPLERAFQQAVAAVMELSLAAEDFAKAREASPASPPLSLDEVRHMIQSYGYSINRHLTRAHNALLAGQPLLEEESMNDLKHLLTSTEVSQ